MYRRKFEHTEICLKEISSWTLKRLISANNNYVGHSRQLDHQSCGIFKTHVGVMCCECYSKKNVLWMLSDILWTFRNE